jgi:nicotinate-nucleotide adenylyltransferase
MKIGLYGGSFDVIHVGHLMLAEYALDAYDLDKVYFIPDGKSSYNDKKFLFSKDFREKCIRQSIKDNPKFFYSPKFINSNKETKTLDIVNHFRKFHPNDELYFICGYDCQDRVLKWYKYQEILEKCKLVFGSTDPINDIEFYMPPVAIRSTLIKELLRKQHSIKYLLHPNICEIVLDYVSKHGRMFK